MGMTKWTLGPKFSSYLSLNFKLMKGAYGNFLLYSILLGAFYARAYVHNMLQYLWLFLLMCLALLISWIPILFKQSISDDSAMLYTSIPVTSFETVVAKTIAAAVGAWIPLIILGNLFLIGFFFSEEKWRIFATLMWNLGFTRQNLLPGMLLIIWIIAALGTVLGGAALQAWLWVNRISGKKKWKQWILYAVCMAVMLATLAGLLWFIWLAVFLPVIVRLLVMLATAGGLSVVLIRLNMAVLEKWYCI